ncbi:MAG: cation diffusion facilitator family transporter, partial [Bacilli bacterium]|nr:cation diffusion facilitator family transporter [Bacilli bacterium]
MSNNRSKIIVRTSLIGILTNLGLVTLKAFVGFIAGSIAIIMDAINNLSDALSSVITIVGTKLAQKKPDAKHPYGHGRVEYITSLIISVIILVAGAGAIVESVLSIINKKDPDFSVVSLILIAIAVVVKIVLG